MIHQDLLLADQFTKLKVKNFVLMWLNGMTFCWRVDKYFRNKNDSKASLKNRTQFERRAE